MPPGIRFPRDQDRICDVDRSWCVLVGRRSCFQVSPVLETWNPGKLDAPFLPDGGVLLDPFAGGGTIFAAGLDSGATRVIGIERVERYVEIAWERIRRGVRGRLVSRKPIERTQSTKLIS